MSSLVYPVGEQDFTKIRERGFVYVDKTAQACPRRPHGATAGAEHQQGDPDHRRLAMRVIRGKRNIYEKKLKE